MEIQGFDLIGFDLFGIDLNTIDINTDNSIDVKESYIPTTQSPYIKGHITTNDNTFTFKVNNTNTNVSVNANGDFKYKPTATITQLDFVGVPELESLELYKINGVTTFNVDYPTKVTFKKCDNTTQNAKVDVYHIRGTATSDFTFTLKYIDDNNTVTTVTESAVIDGNGKWDVAYSGKKINEASNSFKNNTYITDIEITEDFNQCAIVNNLFDSCTNLVTARLPYAIFSKLKTMFTSQTREIFNECVNLEEVYMPLAISLGTLYSTFFNCQKLKTINIYNVDASSINSVNSYTFYRNYKLENLYVPNNSTFLKNISITSQVLTYDSMLRVAGWLADLTNKETQTVTFKNATYNALTEEQKATLEGIIVTQKHWNLATA